MSRWSSFSNSITTLLTTTVTTIWSLVIRASMCVRVSEISFSVHPWIYMKQTFWRWKNSCMSSCLWEQSLIRILELWLILKIQVNLWIVSIDIQYSFAFNMLIFFSIWTDEPSAVSALDFHWNLQSGIFLNIFRFFSVQRWAFREILYGFIIWYLVYSEHC